MSAYRVTFSLSIPGTSYAVPMATDVEAADGLQAMRDVARRYDSARTIRVLPLDVAKALCYEV